MDVRQAEYLKLLGIQAWCKQEDLPRIQAHLHDLKSASSTVDIKSALHHEGANSSHESANIMAPASSAAQMLANATDRTNAPGSRSHQASLTATQGQVSAAGDSAIDPQRFSRQLQGVADGLRVKVDPKASESIEVKKAFTAQPFTFPMDQSIFSAPFIQAIESCEGCDFSQSRNQVTLPRQNPHAKVMVITDIPLKEEMFQGKVLDKQDESFFYKAVHAVGFSPDALYITPFIKCRPPELRDVAEKEWHACFQVLKREILEVNPQVIFLLGRTSVKFLLQKELPFEALRRERHTIVIEGREFPVIISHSPRVYAKNSRLKANFWQDIKFLRRQLG